MLSDQENNGLALIFLIDKRGRELELGGRAIVGERSFRGAGGQISDGSGAVDGGKRGQDRHHANGRQRTIREFLHGRERIGLESHVQEPELCRFVFA